MSNDKKIKTMAERQRKKIPSPKHAERRIWLFNYIATNAHASYKQIEQDFKEKFSVSRTTFTNCYAEVRELLQKTAEKVNESIVELGVENSLKAVKQGLHTKLERLLTLQEQIDQSVAELKENKAFEVSWQNGVKKQTERPLTVQEKATLRRVIKELQAEISKIEGDYTIEKKEIEFKPIQIEVVKQQ